MGRSESLGASAAAQMRLPARANSFGGVARAIKGYCRLCPQSAGR